MSKFTFEDFQRTRRRSDNLSNCVNFPWQIISGPSAGFIYLDRFCIKQEPSGDYYLKIGNDEWVCGDIEVLELRLYDFVREKGYAPDAVH